MVGSRLKVILENQGYNVKILGRKCPENCKPGDFFYWDPARESIDEAAIPWADHIVNLAGAGIADRSWSVRRKQEIIESRLQASRFINACINQYPGQIKTLIAASAIGYYGNRDQEKLNESASPGTGYLSEVCMRWEAESLNALTRVVIFRIGIVLSKKGGALPQLVLPLRFYTRAILGNGKQFYSWIHLDDLCMMIQFVLQKKELGGIYNAVAPEPVTQEELMLLSAEIKLPGSIKFHVPAFLLRWVLGERAVVVLDSQQVVSEKIVKAGYQFLFPNCREALTDLLT